MKLFVLGAIRPSVNLRNKVFARGGMLLRWIQYLGSNLKYISLNALETVITLYYKFGWRFKYNCEATELGKYAEGVKLLYNLMKNTGGYPDDEILTQYLHVFRV